MNDEHDHRRDTDNEGMHDTGTELLSHTVPQDRETPHRSASHREAVEQRTAPEPPVSRSRNGLIAGVVVLLALAILIYTGIHSRRKNVQALTQSANASAIQIVRVTHPTGPGQTPEVVLPANVTAYIDTPIFARTNGYIRGWYHDIGARVQKGTLLATIETPELDQQVTQAQADVRTAQSNLELAQTTNIRWQKLVAKNAVSRQEADQTSSDLAAKQSALAAQQANLQRLRQTQDFEHIYAPFTGVITARNIDIGSLIEAGQNTTQKELFHLAATDRLRVFVPVPEVYQSAVHDGERVPVTVDAFPNERFYGTLMRSSRAVDPASRTINVEVDIENTTGKLLPGAYAFVHLTVPSALQAITVPSNTLLFRAQGLQVGVVENGHVVLHGVKVGHDYGATIEITDGLKPSDAIVLDPSDSLEGGQEVRAELAAPLAGETPAVAAPIKRAGQ
jgi:RND family efflux transporter MFP subunit